MVLGEVVFLYTSEERTKKRNIVNAQYKNFSQALFNGVINITSRTRLLGQGSIAITTIGLRGTKLCQQIQQLEKALLFNKMRLHLEKGTV